MAVDQMAGALVDDDLLNPADVVQRGRQGCALMGGMESEVGGLASASETLSVPLPVMRLRQGVLLVVLDMGVVLSLCGQNGMSSSKSPRPCGGPGGCRAGLARASPSRADELHAVGDHLDGLVLAAVLGLPASPAQPAVDRHLASFGEVVRAALALGAEDRDGEVVGMVLPSAAVFVLDAVVDGETQAAAPVRGARLSELRVAGEVADENDSIDGGSTAAVPFAKDGLGFIRRVVAGRRLTTTARDGWDGWDGSCQKSPS